MCVCVWSCVWWQNWSFCIYVLCMSDCLHHVCLSCLCGRCRPCLSPVQAAKCFTWVFLFESKLAVVSWLCVVQVVKPLADTWNLSFIKHWFDLVCVFQLSDTTFSSFVQTNNPSAFLGKPVNGLPQVSMVCFPSHLWLITSPPWVVTDITSKYLQTKECLYLR